MEESKPVQVLARDGFGDCRQGLVAFALEVKTIGHQGDDKLGLRGILPQYADDQRLVEHYTPKRTAEMILNRCRRAIASELDAGSWFNSKFADEQVPTVEEVLELVAEYRQHDVLVAVDLKAKNVAQDVVRLAERHGVLDRLLFIGRTISEPQVREEIKAASDQAHAAAVANNPDEFDGALAAPNADWVYFRYLPPNKQVKAVRRANKRAFIAGATVAGNLPKNWQQAVDVGINGILTDFPFELAAMLREKE